MKTIVNTVLITFLLTIANSPFAQVVTKDNGWNIRTDSPMQSLQVDNGEEADIFMEQTEQGLRITTGPRAIYWRTDDKAQGIFKLKTSLRLYDTKGRDREGYGLFFGGSELDTGEIYYLYFLLRNTGDYLIKLRTGDQTSVIKDWTSDNGINTYKADSEMDFAQNELGVNVSDESLTFLINGRTVHTVGKQGLNPDGIFGLRINHAVDLMMEQLNVAER